VNDAGNVTKKREQNIDPEVYADAYLQEDANRRQEDRDDDA
jgi:hypothetical protein